MSILARTNFSGKRLMQSKEAQHSAKKNTFVLYIHHPTNLGAEFQYLGKTGYRAKKFINNIFKQFKKNKWVESKKVYWVLYQEQ